MPAGQIIGRVSVKVLPDTEDFRSSAKKKLTAIEKQLPEIKVQTKIDMSGAKIGFLEEIRKFNAENRMKDSRKVKVYATFDSRSMNEEITKGVRKLNDKAQGRRINMRANLVASTLVLDLDKDALKDVEDKLKRWRDRQSPMKIVVRPELALGSTTFLNKRLDYMTRPRKVPIVPMLNTGATAKVAAGLATLVAAASGGRVVSSMLRNMFDVFKNIDKIAPAIGAVGLGILGLAGYALSAASNLFALSASLASIGALALTLPATFAAGAIGIGTMIAVLKDFNTVLPQVKSQLARLQDSMSEKFWAKAKAPIQGFINDLLPKFTAGFNRTADAMGGFTATFANAFKGLLTGQLDGMFNGMIAGLNNAKGAAAPLAGIITTLGSIGAQYLPAMGTWLTDIAVRFNDFLTAAANDGSLKGWIDTGLVALQDLGQVLKNAGTILSGFAKAASAAGGSTLGMVADTLERVSDAVNSPAFQTGLVNVLTAAHAAMSAISTTAGPAMERLFSTLGGTLTKLLPIAGEAIGTLLSSVGNALSNPVLQSGLVSLFEGINNAITALAPAMGPIATLMGVLGVALGQFLTTVGPILGTVLTTVANMGMDLLPALMPLVSLLGGALTIAIKMLAPVFEQLAGTIADFMSGGGLQLIGTVIGALLPVIGMLAPLIGNVLAQAFAVITPLLPIIGNLFATIVPLVGQLIAALFPLVSALLPALAAIFGAVIPIVTQIAAVVLPILIGAITKLVGAMVPVITLIAQLIVWLLGKLAPVFVFLATVIAEFVAGFIGNFTGVFESIMGIFEGFKTMFSGGWSAFFTGLWMVVVNILKLIWNVIMIVLNVTILGAVKKFFGVIKGLFKGGWDTVRLLAMYAWDFMKALPGRAFAVMKSAVTGGLNLIKGGFSAGWNAVKSVVSLAWTSIRVLVSEGIDKAIVLVKSLPSKATSALSNIGTALKNAGTQLIAGFITGINDMFGNVKDTLQGLTKKLTDWKGPESLDRVLLVNAGKLVIGGFINGLESQYDAVHRSLSGLTGSLSDSMSVSAPNISASSLGGVDSALAGAGGSAAGSGVYAPQITVPMMPTNSTPEDVADAILFAQKRFAYGSAYAS